MLGVDRITQNSDRSLSIVTWKDVRNDVIDANEDLAAIIDEISPNDNYKLILAEYKYGDIFIDGGVVRLPYMENNIDLLPLTHASLNNKVQKELSYTTMPLMLMLDKSNEVFIDTGARIIPINLFPKGSFTGVYETMDFLTGRKATSSMWNFSAGSRSIFMLPKITDSLGLTRLRREYNIPSTFHITSLSDHWDLFRTIAQHEKFKDKWKCRILLFGENWVNNKNESAAWKKFKKHILKEIWSQAQFAIDKFKFSLGWEKFAEAIALRRLQPTTYVVDQIKHILSIGAGNFPAFSPVDDSQQVAPTLALQNVFVDIYMLREYLPTILYAHTLNNKKSGDFVYYSLSFQTLLEGTTLKKKSSTIMLDMREMKMLFDTLKKHSLKLADAYNNSIIEQARIDFFHVDDDRQKEITISTQIADDDKRFLTDKKTFPSRNICFTAPFFKGCIRIGL